MKNPRNNSAHLINPQRLGLLVVDVQEKLWPHIHEKEKVLNRIQQAIVVSGHLDVPVFVAEQYVRGLGSTVAELASVLATSGAALPIEKMSFSCFGEPAFVENFTSSGIDTLAIVGIETHVCVMQTALDALERELKVFVISEATGCRDPEHKKEALERLRSAGAIVGSVEMFAFEAMGTAKHPAFKAVQKVIV